MMRLANQTLQSLSVMDRSGGSGGAWANVNQKAKAVRLQLKGELPKALAALNRALGRDD
jgi:hypothetical protein